VKSLRTGVVLSSLLWAAAAVGNTTTGIPDQSTIGEAFFAQVPSFNTGVDVAVVTQGVTPGAGVSDVCGVQFVVFGAFTPGPINVSIQSDTAGTPSGVTLGAPVQVMVTAAGPLTVDFPAPISIPAGQPYHIVIEPLMPTSMGFSSTNVAYAGGSTYQALNGANPGALLSGSLLFETYTSGVGGGSIPVPTLSEWGMILLVACMGLFGLITVRSKRARINQA
jgi:hypothetical protein